VNLRAADRVVVLSQRYGPPLPAPFDQVSATHAEYREARSAGKPILFYVRDRLIAEWTAWKRNGRDPAFKTTWAKQEDAASLFGFIDEHQRLVGPGGSADANNWYWPFTSSVDLRADLRHRLAAGAFLATGERLVKAGQAPILLVVGQGLSTFMDGSGDKRYYRFKFDVVNAGPVAALGLQGELHLAGSLHRGDDARAGAVLPGQAPARVSIQFDIPAQSVFALFNGDEGSATCALLLGYSAPTGHVLQDHFQVDLHRRGREVTFERSPLYEGKRITGMCDYLTGARVSGN
jgi:hypothetical protein